VCSCCYVCSYHWFVKNSGSCRSAALHLCLSYFVIAINMIRHTGSCHTGALHSLCQLVDCCVKVQASHPHTLPNLRLGLVLQGLMRCPYCVGFATCQHCAFAYHVAITVSCCGLGCVGCSSSRMPASELFAAELCFAVLLFQQFTVTNRAQLVLLDATPFLFLGTSRHSLLLSIVCCVFVARCLINACVKLLALLATCWHLQNWFSYGVRG
jgi:hypothetical protein